MCRTGWLAPRARRRGRRKLKAHQDAKQPEGAVQQDHSHDGAAGIGTGSSNGTKELRRSALAAQAFLRMLENGGGKGKANRADLVIVCDLQAWRRGHAREGEPCHIIGGGPIPVSLAKEIGGDAFLKAVLHTGTELHTIAHFGRLPGGAAHRPGSRGAS